MPNTHDTLTRLAETLAARLLRLQNQCEPGSDLHLATADAADALLTFIDELAKSGGEIDPVR